MTLGWWRGPENSEPTGDELTFHAYASEWLERKRRELRSTTIADYEWRLTSHLLPFFAKYRLAAIDRRAVDEYSTQDEDASGDLAGTGASRDG